MKIWGRKYLEVEVNPYEVIDNLCEELGLTTHGTIITEVENGKVEEVSYNVMDEKITRVIFDNPYDVELASTLLSFYKKLIEIKRLPDKNKKDIKLAKTFHLYKFE